MMLRPQDQQAAESWDALRERQPWWLQLCLAIIGVGLDWRCAFEWFAGKSPSYSELVLGRTGLIVLACAGVALLAVFVVRGARLRHALIVFCTASFLVYEILHVHWLSRRG